MVPCCRRNRKVPERTQALMVRRTSKQNSNPPALSTCRPMSPHPLSTIAAAQLLPFPVPSVIANTSAGRAMPASKQAPGYTPALDSQGFCALQNLVQRMAEPCAQAARHSPCLACVARELRAATRLSVAFAPLRGIWRIDEGRSSFFGKESARE